MTTCPLTLHLFEIPDFQKHYSDSPPPVRLTSPPATISYSQEEITAERASFLHDWGDPYRNAGGYRNTFENLQGRMKLWETCWDRCIHAQGDYFEGDGGN
jgi:hypothetical protein